MRRGNALEAEGVLVEAERRTIALAHMERDVDRVERLEHGALRLQHQLGRQTELAVSAHHCERGDVAMGLLRRVLLPAADELAAGASRNVIAHIFAST